MSHPLPVIKHLDRDLSRSPAADGELARLEDRLGSALPAVVKQWYGYREALEVMREFSNQDHPIPVAKFHAIAVEEWGPIVPFMIENQGVCEWAFCLDETEDPRVVVQINSQACQRCADHFSAYLVCLVMDGLLMGSARYAAQSVPLDDGDLAGL